MAQANRGRRRHGAEFKQRVLAECDRPGASVATVALSHGVNANLVHKWRRQRRPVSAANASFVPVRVSELTAPVMAATAASAVIEIDVRRGATVLQIRWPVSAAPECAAWLRGWLA
jgi:transposase